MSVYVVWTDVLLGDDRSKVEVNLIPDPRATLYWDNERLLATWFPQQEAYESLTFGPIIWDIYFLYGPEAEWKYVPEPLVTSGHTVIRKRGDLERGLGQLLTAN